MQEGLVEVEPKVAHALPEENIMPSEAGQARKKTPLNRIFIARLVKFLSFRKKNQAGAVPHSTKKVQEPKERLEGPCGLGCVVIPCSQCCNNIRCFLVFFCILVTSQCIVFGLVDMSNDIFLKNSNLKTAENLVLSLTYDISSCLVVVFIAYYGGKGSIPRWITASSFLVGFGSLLFAFPYFSGGFNEENVESEVICQERRMAKVCKKSSLSFQSKYMTFFILGQCVQGIAAIPLYVLGITFIYKSVATHSAAIYLGIVEAAGISGYASGYAIGPPIIKTSGNSSFEKSIEDSKQHQPRNWGMNFVVISVIAWCTLIPLSCFPRNVRGTARVKAGKHRQPYLLDRDQSKDQEFGPNIKDLLATFWILIKSPIFIYLSLCRASESLVMIGASEFLPLYIENQFILTHSEATTIAGLVLIPGGALGQILGGIIISKLQMTCKSLMRFVMVTSAISLVLLAFVILVHCDTIPFAGINEDYGGTGQLGNLTAPCNSRCKCSSSLYSATCGRNDIGYFSPCFAGCTHSKTFKNRKTYYNCSCIKEGLTTSDNEGDFIDARHGTCASKCYKLPLFLAFVFSTILFSAFANVPSILTILRIVSDKQRSLALGVTFVILRIFGTIPGPIIFKIVGKASCLFRDTEHCGSTENCWIYNKTKMVYLLVGVCLICKAVTIIFTAAAFGLYKYLPKENGDIVPTVVKHLKVKKRERTDL